MASTLVEIIGRDSTGAAFDSATGRIQGLANSASRLNGVLGAIGATAVVGALGSFVKSTIDAQDHLFKLSQKTGIAVESLAGLGFAAEQSGVELETVAKGVRKFSLLVAEAADASSGAAQKLKQLGLSYQQLKDLSPEKQLLALSDALSKFSKEDRAIAFISTFGNKMADLIPLLSQGSNGLGRMIEQGKKLNPVTERSAELAEKYNSQITVLGKSVSALGQSMVVELIPSLTRTADAMVKAGESGGFLSGALAGVRQLFTEAFGNPKILGDVGQIRREIFKTQDVISQMSAKKGSAFFDANALEFEKVKLQQLEGNLQTALTASRANAAATKDNTEETKKFAIALDGVNTPKVTSGINRLSEAQKKAKEEQQQLNRMMSEGNNLSESVDPILKRNNALAKYVDLLKIGALSQDNFNKLATNAINDAEKATAKNTDALKTLNTETRNTTNEVSQLWTQAGRNIQSALATSIFNFFDDGLKGMVKSVGIAVGRIMSEFAALRIAQTIGLDRMFGGGSGQQINIKQKGLGLLTGLTGAELGVDVLSKLGGGFGTTSFIGSSLARVGGTLGMFGSGMAGASAGVFGGAGGAGTAFIGGSGTALGGSGMGAAAGMGASFAAAAGPAMALIAVDAIGRLLAGNKTIKGFGSIPVVGGFLSAMFGHAPFKFRQQSLQGTASASGFSGDITDVDRAKGGWFVSNKHRSTKSAIPNDIQMMLDSSMTGFAKSTRSFAETLGLSVDVVDSFSKQVQIKSEKGKKLTDEAVNEMLRGLGDDMATAVLPSIDSFRRVGETASTTLRRLSTEFSTLTTASTMLGKSVSEANDFIKSISIESRSAFLDAAGGIDSFGQQMSFFSQNFLTDAERMAPVQQQLSMDMQKIGLSSSMTMSQFKGLIQSFGQVNGITQDTFFSLLKLAPAFVQVKSAVEITTSAATAAARNISQIYAASYGEIKRLRDFVASMQSTVNTMTSGSYLTDARRAISGQADLLHGRAVDAEGRKLRVKDYNPDISGALGMLTGMGTGTFSTGADFRRAQGQNIGMVNELISGAEYQIEKKRMAIRRSFGSYAVGTSFVPETGLNMNHRGERIINPDQNRDLIFSIKSLVSAVMEGNVHARKTAKILTSVTQDGNSLLTTAA